MLFIALGVVWGIPYLLIKVAVDELSPAQIVLARTAIAALILLPLALAQGAVRPVLGRWRWLLVFAVVEIAIPWVFLGSAETRLPSSTTGSPRRGGAAGGRRDRVRHRAMPSDSPGSPGWAWSSGSSASPPSSGSTWAAPTSAPWRRSESSSSGTPRVRPSSAVRFRDCQASGSWPRPSPLTALAYVPVVLLTDGLPGPLPSGNVVASVVTLGVVCTAAAFMLLFALVGEVGPVRATTITYLNPAVAVVAGAVVLGEPVTVWTVIGFVLVVTGSYLVNRGGRPQPTGEVELAGETSSSCA